MRKIVLAFLIILVSASIAFGASTKVSELTETQTLTDSDIFLVSTYADGSYTSKYIATSYLKTALGNVTTILNDTLWDAAGDLVYGTGANAGARLAIGAPYALLMTNSGATAPAWTYELGATGTRLTKIWATDLEVTNAPTVNGAALTTILQPLDGELTALAGLTSDANAIPYFTGSGTAGLITSSDDMVSLLESADYATALTNLGGWGVSGSITDEQLVCAETTGGSNLLKSCGAKTTINAGNSTLLCKDSAGEVEACGGVTISGTTSPIVNVNPQEVDGHTTSTYLTAAQVSNTIIHNYDQAASDVFLILPTAAAGYSFLVTITTARSNHFGVEAGANDKIYLIAAAGTVAAGDDGAAVVFVAAQVGQQAACWTFKTGASSYDWACKAIAIGTSTFEAHASSE